MSNRLTDLDVSQCQVMGILNVTPDSFSDGGRLYEGAQLSIDAVLRQAETMIGEGASILDIGGESTRPGAETVAEAQELERVVPVIEAIANRLDIAISVDTSTAAVMIEAAKAGAHLINDVRALRREGAFEAAVATRLPVCLMHMLGTDPKTMQNSPSYENIGAEVTAFLIEQRARLIEAGYTKSQVWFDPGYGFGKTLEQNYQLLNEQAPMSQLGSPLLVGFSRKSMIGKLDNSAATERLGGSVSLAVMAADRGARIFRVHDVQPHVQALRVWQMANRHNN